MEAGMHTQEQGKRQWPELGKKVLWLKGWFTLTKANSAGSQGIVKDLWNIPSPGLVLAKYRARPKVSLKMFFQSRNYLNKGMEESRNHPALANARLARFLYGEYVSFRPILFFQAIQLELMFISKVVLYDGEKFSGEKFWGTLNSG